MIGEESKHKKVKPKIDSSKPSVKPITPKSSSSSKPKTSTSKKKSWYNELFLLLEWEEVDHGG